MASSSAVNNVSAAIPVQASKSAPSRHSSDDESKVQFKRALDDARTEHEKSSPENTKQKNATQENTAQKNAASKAIAAEKRIKHAADDAGVATTDKTPNTPKKSTEAASLESVTSEKLGDKLGDMAGEEVAEPLIVTDNNLALIETLPTPTINTDAPVTSQTLFAPLTATSELSVVTASAESDSLASTLATAIPSAAGGQQSVLTTSSSAQAAAPAIATTGVADTDAEAKLAVSAGLTSTETPEAIGLTDAAVIDADGALPSDGADAKTAALNAVINGAVASDKAASPVNNDKDALAAKTTGVATPTAPTASATATTSANADASTNLTNPSLTNTDIKTDKQAVAANDNMVAVDDEAVVTDPKLVFEKMLKNMTTTNMLANGVEGRSPESLDRASGLSPAPSSAMAGLESLLRGTDSQAPAARSFVVQTAVPVPVGQPQWSQAVGEKVLWLAAQNVQSADINLNPLDLGPVQVKISVNQEQTTVNFTSHHAGVREVLDQNLGRLREMFSEQGLNLVNVDVSDKSFQRQQGDGNERQGQGGRGESENDETVVATSAIVSPRLVDHYA